MNPERAATHADTEAALASTQLRDGSHGRALLRFYARHERVTAHARAMSPIKPDCRAGCAWCCHFKVEATALEVLAIATRVATLPPERREAMVLRAATNTSATAGLSYAEHRASNQPCPFLVDSACSVYDVRPALCRNYHSTDAGQCRSAFDAPDNRGFVDTGIDELSEAGYGATAGFRRASTAAGIDSRLYDLDSAFLEAMRDPRAGARLAAGERVFHVARVVGEPEGHFTSGDDTC